MYQLGNHSRKYLKTVKNKDLIILVSQAILLTKQDFCIIHNGGYRTAEEQNEIFKRGASRCDGYKFKSNHQSGNAVDLVPFIKGKATWNEEATDEIVRVMKNLAIKNNINLECGADWKGFYDPYHFQIGGL